MMEITAKVTLLSVIVLALTLHTSSTTVTPSSKRDDKPQEVKPASEVGNNVATKDKEQPQQGPKAMMKDIPPTNLNKPEEEYRVFNLTSGNSNNNGNGRWPWFSFG